MNLNIRLCKNAECAVRRAECAGHVLHPRGVPAVRVSKRASLFGLVRPGVGRGGDVSFF